MCTGEQYTDSDMLSYIGNLEKLDYILLLSDR